MNGFTKLFSSILDSTIWQEPNETRILWITMLAMTDAIGEVQASIPGLAKRAGISIEQCEEALQTLMSPDQYSRTKDFEGRRIEEVDGGWVLLNHGRYRALLSSDERREYFRLKQADRRAKLKESAVKETYNNVKECTAGTHITEAEAEAEAEAESTITLFESEPEGSNGNIIDEIYQAYPRKVGKGYALKSIKKAIKNINPKLLLQRVKEYAKATEQWNSEERRFIPHPSTWFNDERWDDDQSEWTRNTTPPASIQSIPKSVSESPVKQYERELEEDRIAIQKERAARIERERLESQQQELEV